MKFKEIKKCCHFYLLPYKGSMLPCTTKEKAFALLKTLEQGGECAFNSVDILRSSDVDYDGLAYEWSLYYQCGRFCIQEVTIYPNTGRAETYFKPFTTFDEAVEEFDSLNWEIVY